MSRIFVRVPVMWTVHRWESKLLDIGQGGV
jgi:hypothetical protein